jgi:hypothetical protein
MRDAKVPTITQRRENAFCWVLIGLVLLSLIICLATRFDAGTQSKTWVQSSASQAMRQHMSQDGFTWTSPVLQLALRQAPTFYPRVAPAGPPLSNLFLEPKLYNRPPPGC